MRGKMLVILSMGILLSSVCVMDCSLERERPATPGDSSAVYALAGEFRTVAANLLWLKCEKYHHEFVEHGGRWDQNKEMMPLIKLIVDLDPHFIEAYLTGAWMLGTGLNKPEESLKFLHQGLNNNPNSPELYEEMGTLYVRHLNNPQKGLECLRKALSLTKNDDFERQKLQRLIKTVQRICDEGYKQPVQS